ncbi:hypothetical protein WS70_21365 [Burkholderia mayonis]|uniref:HEAT repeat domain-containing protein n=1 Tax=Burkholderia mayonis TaxID=1385591 RepID=A0A1B4FL57_9BURK|nr:hypothetical protein WS70_21365 [Burkholderia mayonis]KVE37782.1 hypothetical protein WS69_09865 [Burkholderia sp. BDU5]KVE40295.1 hypothetical protein WS70_18125 [Burkholderia mayonis]
MRSGTVSVKEYRQQIEAQLQTRRVSAAAEATAAPVDSDPIAIWNQALEHVVDSTLDPAGRRGALQILQAASFLAPQFASLHAEYLDTLRRLATDADSELRRMALDVLSNQKDDFARQKLTEGLSSPEDALVAPAVALGFLARDDHGSAHDIARDLLKQSTDQHVREQAVRVLGAAPAAKSLLDAVMKDKTEFRQVRRASAVALRALDPQMFAKCAQDILEDESDFEDIKATVAGALQRANVTPATPPSAPTKRPAKKGASRRRR